MPTTASVPSTVKATLDATSASPVPLMHLPLAPSLPHFLKPDPLFPSPNVLKSLSNYRPPNNSTNSNTSNEQANTAAQSPVSPPPPSMLRKARMIREGGNFAYVTPLPMEFPYSIQESVAQRMSEEDGINLSEMDIETYLSKLEPDSTSSSSSSAVYKGPQMSAYTSDFRNRFIPSPRLLSISANCRDNVIPNLDISSDEAKEQLTQVLGGRYVVFGNENSNSKNGDETDGDDALDAGKCTTLAPWALCYGGHQFGNWAGQLGDGRAFSILTTPTEYPTSEYSYPPVAELQLKGAGRTPFSRFADGLAVLRSSVREYLGAEGLVIPLGSSNNSSILTIFLLAALAALSIPTSRSLALVHYPSINVERERVESAAVVTRVAPSWLRIGNFEIQRTNREWDSLGQLVNFAATKVHGFQQDQSYHARELLHDVARRNGKTIAKWQAVGFMHGVMNSDNISILGLTIDYGPYAFMDIFDKGQICNHTDDEGRYSYLNQPNMGKWAIRKLGEALQDILGAEMARNGKKVTDSGWFEKGKVKDDGTVEEWRKNGLEETDKAIKTFEDAYEDEYRQRMIKRLGLTDGQEQAASVLAFGFLNLLNDHGLDMSHSFRALAEFDSVESAGFTEYLANLVPEERVPQFLKGSYQDSFIEWFQRYEKEIKIADEKVKTGARSERIKASNPRFVLRQWVLEETISRLEKNNDVEFLDRVLKMCERPFDGWGEEDWDENKEESSRLCGIGETEMLGFQCSCSS